MDSLKVTDEQSKAVQKTPNRVALADIEAAIMTEYCFTADKALGDAPIVADVAVLTICIIVMNNGFSVIGKSAPADPANFNEELGRKFAREDAIRQLWPLMGFALRDRINAAPQYAPSRGGIPHNP